MGRKEQIWPVAGLPAAAGPSRRPAPNWCGRDSEAARGEVPERAVDSEVPTTAAP